MTMKFRFAASAALAAILLSGGSAARAADGQTLLTARFEPRAVAKVEGGDFHFLPGQPAPEHTHLAPVIGYVVKGTILFQVAGQPVQTLRAGDAFYEPVGPEILRFDNGSATEEAVFIDTNWQRADDPFIHFDKPLTEKIDRRTLTTALLDGATLSAVDAKRVALAAGESVASASRAAPGYAYVAEGALDLHAGNLPVQRVEAGQSFSVPKGAVALSYAAANGKPAVVVTFEGRAD